MSGKSCSEGDRTSRRPLCQSLRTDGASSMLARRQACHVREGVRRRQNSTSRWPLCRSSRIDWTSSMPARRPACTHPRGCSPKAELNFAVASVSRTEAQRDQIVARLAVCLGSQTAALRDPLCTGGSQETRLAGALAHGRKHVGSHASLTEGCFKNILLSGGIQESGEAQY